MDPKRIRIASYDYALPEERIAKFPLAQRDASKLLVYKSGTIEESNYRNLYNHLPNGSALYFNNTRVVQARLRFQNRNGRAIELFCLEPSESQQEITSAMAQTGGVTWTCLVGGAKKWKEDVLEASVTFNGNPIHIQARKISRDGPNFTIAFSWSPESLSFAELLETIGETPLPPYMKRDAETSDKNRYQTVYAENNGSVAAPTAGLHFTPELLNNLKKTGNSLNYLTLHVGAGTFKPVQTEEIEHHEMHFEFIEVSAQMIDGLIQKLKASKPIVAVGTTSMRTLESLYWIGIKLYENPTIPTPEIHQWDPYELQNPLTVTEALKAVREHLKYHNKEQLVTRTQLIIAPGYQFRVVVGLITNFHQPKSTLLLLVSALIGNDWESVYAHALNHNFRFLSYGDGSLLWKV